MFNRAIGGKRTTVGAYGDGALSIPAWAQQDADNNLHVVSLSETPDPHIAAQRVVDAINIDWLSAHGDVDQRTSDVVHTWMNKVVETARRPGIETFAMDFDNNLVLTALWKIDFYDATTGYTHDVWWPDRVLQHAY